MQQAAFVIRCLLTAAALPGLVSALSSDPPIRAEVQHPLATPDRANDPDVAAFKLKFDVRLTNRSEKVMDLPAFSADEDDTTRMAVLGVQAKQRDGTWAFISQSSWYDDGKIKYQSCRSLLTGETGEITGVVSGLFMLRKQLVSLGGEPIVRLNLMIFCRQPDGKVRTASVTTDEFGLRLPAQP